MFKDKYWDLGRIILTGGAACILIGGICLGTGQAQVSEQTQSAEPAASASQPATQEETKEEVVYATLSAAGSVDAVYVVNHFVTSPGTQITDYGAYTEVANLTDTSPVSLDDGEVTFTSASDSFYYQGNLGKADLPWDFAITYRLDGREVESGELAGKSGHLEIALRSKENGSSGQVFYDNYMLQIQVTLDTALAKNVDAPGSIAASAGSDQVFTYTVLPGDHADIELSCDVQNFEMPGITISGMPYSMDIEFPDMGDSLSDLEKLPDAIAQLNEGVGELENGTRDMRSGAEQLQSGSAGIQSGLSLLSGSGSSLRRGSSQISSALNQIVSSLGDAGLDDIDLGAVQALPESLGQLKNGLDGLSGGLSQLEGGFSGAYGALENAIDNIPGPEISQSDIEGVMSRLTETGDMYVVGTLAANYEAAQTVRGTFEEIRPAFASVEPVLSEVAGGIDQMSDQLGDALEGISGQLSGLSGLSQLRRLQSGLEELADSYSDFDDGLSGYVSGVSELASQYSSFHSGLRSLTSGVGTLHAGVGELREGTTTLQNELSDLPDLIQEEIDKMKADYLPPDFEPVSFTSAKNEDTSFVQFVLQCDGIRKPDAASEDSGEQDTADETFWDRVTALFS
ncbi:MAG: YhgE/Pip domain-containing protein [Clostridia bacterium]|nr:YhgE/Pip domain-containing protein [Clostridia bacterium]